MNRQLQALIVEFRAMDNVTVTNMIRRNAAAAARPFAPAVRASIMNTPAHGPKHTGLRARIARCVQTWAEIRGNVVSVGVEVNASKMPSGQMSLPLYLEGSKAPWRHPLFGHDPWYGQDAHPYFWQAVALYGPASQRAVQRAADRIAFLLDNAS